MPADLELLLISVYCTADDLLPAPPRNARRRITDAEAVTLLIAQVLMGIPSDRRFLRAARRQLSHLFPYLPSQSGLHKRRGRLRATLDWLCGLFASGSPGYYDPVVLLDSTPLEAGRSVETAQRSELADAAGYGYCQSHSRWFWGFRLHLAASPDGTPRAAMLVGADRKERDIAREHLLPAIAGTAHTVICDKGYASRELAQQAAQLGITLLRPARKDEPGRPALPLKTIRQRIESITWTAKDLLNLERHAARTLHGLGARIATRLLTLTACIWFNHQHHRPARAIADLT